MKNFLLSLCFITGTLSVFAQGGWTKITSPSNPVTAFNAPGYYKGAAWVDVDNDGDVDLFACPNFLFINQGSGNFTQSPQTFYTSAQSSAGCSFGDLDNDGDLDFIISNDPSGIFFNNGIGTFTNITSSVPTLTSYAAWGCAIGDANKDAFPEFVYAHAAGFHAGIAKPSKYYINTGSFSPQLKTGYAFTDSLRPYTVPYWSDYDLDGDMDLFIASGPANGTPAYDYCYKNLKIETGKDTLQRMTTELFASQKQDGQCYNFIDADNDGDFDLCLTNYLSAPSRFYKNTAGTYSSVTTPFTITGNSLANCWGDYDNDGDLDVVITKDNAVSQAYQNNGAGVFTLLSAGISVPAGASGVSNGDYDNDGDLDLFFNGLNSSRSLYRNDTVALNRNWINFNLTGTASNKSAIGAIVKLKAVINSIPTWQLREVNAQNSFQSQNDLRVHFGLDKAIVVDSLIVKWPSGLQQTFTGLAVNSFYQLTEGNPFIPLAIAADTKRPDVTVVPNPASDRVEIRVSESYKPYTFELLDLAGHNVYKGKAFGFSAINTSTLESGIYFLQLHSGEETISKKIIVLH